MDGVRRTIPGNVDSTGKLLHRLALVSKNGVFQNGSLLDNIPDLVAISPSILRQFTCVVGCNACCLPFTLDFSPEEFDTLEWTDDISTQAIRDFSPREIEVNGTLHRIYSYPQYKDASCPYKRPNRETCPVCKGTGQVEDKQKSLGGEPLKECHSCAGTGRALGCGFWTKDNSTQPLECAAAPQVLMTTRGVGTTMIMKRPFGRGWAWKIQPQCVFDPVIDKIAKIPDEYDLSVEIKIMERYLHWADYLGIETHLPAIIEGLQDFPNLLRASNLQSVIVYER